MKKILFLLALSLTIVGGASAQKIRYKKDTVKVDDVPYCVITSKGTFTPTYTVKSLAGKETVIAKWTQVSLTSNLGYYLVTFLESGQQCEMPTVLGYGKTLGEALYEAKVFQDGVYNADGERKFLLLHGTKISEQVKDADRIAARVGTNNNNEGRGMQAGNRPTRRLNLVTRNRESDVTVWFGEKSIKQDFKVIGKYTKEQNGMKLTFRFSLPDGTEVAKATMVDVFAKSAQLLIIGNVDTYEIPVDGISAEDFVKAIALHLINIDLL